MGVLWYPMAFLLAMTLARRGRSQSIPAWRPADVSDILGAVEGSLDSWMANGGRDGQGRTQRDTASRIRSPSREGLAFTIAIVGLREGLGRLHRASVCGDGPFR